MSIFIKLLTQPLSPWQQLLFFIAKMISKHQ